MQFIQENLKPADILAGRNLDPAARTPPLIRSILGSYTNHTALIVWRGSEQRFMIGDTTPPHSRKVELNHYEDLVTRGLYEVRIWRVREMDDAERRVVSCEWQLNHENIDYSEWGVKRLWIMRFVNHLPYEIKGSWCTKNTLEPFGKVLPPERDPRTRPDGKFKHNPTPRTVENRLVAGVLEDVTPLVVQL